MLRSAQMTPTSANSTFTLGYEDSASHSCLRLQIQARLHLERPGLVRGRAVLPRFTLCCALLSMKGGTADIALAPAHWAVAHRSVPPALHRLLNPLAGLMLFDENLRGVLIAHTRGASTVNKSKESQWWLTQPSNAF